MIKVQRVIHKIWQEWESIPGQLRDRTLMKGCIIGKYQYIYTEGKIRISLVRLNYSLGGSGIHWQNHQWEICGGGLTEDVETFATKKDAVKRIKELMGRHVK